MSWEKDLRLNVEDFSYHIQVDIQQFENHMSSSGPKICNIVTILL